MSRWFRVALWAQLVSLLSPYAAVLVQGAMQPNVCTTDQGCSRPYLGILELAVELYGLPSAIVLAHAFGGRRVDGRALGWLLATDAWLVLASALVLRSLSSLGPALAIPVSLILAMAVVTAAGGMSDLWKSRPLALLTTLKE